jgi:murein L,D-transpeptidase YcbB/YkuD
MALAEAVSLHGSIHEFYQDRDFVPLWTDGSVASEHRRLALIASFAEVNSHGLAPQSTDVESLLAGISAETSFAELAQVELNLTRAYLRYARSVGTGMVKPNEISPDEMVRRVKPVDTKVLLDLVSGPNPAAALASVPPQSRQYLGLRKQKRRLERIIDAGGWGMKIPDGPTLQIGDSGPRVIALRDRLVRLGFLEPTAQPEFDLGLDFAVKAFQSRHGLSQDGVVGQGTLAELNKSASDRWMSVIVALERERWLPRDLGVRHILVNQTDFTAKIFDHGDVSFETRAVIGQNVKDQRSPEFSDLMEHMVINPSWHVPRSIITKEYLPQLQADPYAVNFLEITDTTGAAIGREDVDFTQFTEETFPFAMRQPPSASNALGLVKFMFPNRHNIYLHDTPQKSLFARERRAFSHGCIRLRDPFDFAYALLALQEDDPVTYFQRTLNSGREATVPLKTPVPVHLIYRTAIIGPRGEVGYRRDVYGRDGQIWNALRAAGVSLVEINS